jgi:phage-related protein (TIGR01555 family)
MGTGKTLLKRAKVLGEIITRRDSWVNAVTGLGTAARDKAVSSTFARSAPLSDETLEALYHGDPFAAKIVDKLPLEAFREGFDLTCSEEMEPEEKARQEQALRDKLDSLGVDEKAPQAAIWGRLFGGGILFIGADDGQEVEEPLRLEGIKEVRFITVMDKRDLQPSTFYEDPKEDKFGEVETYRFTPVSSGISGAKTLTGTIIHESRLIIFPGVLTSQRERQYLNHWDHSVIHRAYTTLRSYGADWASVSTMLADASQGILKIKDFYEVMSGGAKETFEERLAIVDLARFVGRIMPIDAEEEFTYQDRTFAGIPDILEKDMLRMASVADMPVTVLMGQSPAGMNATGESDQTVWFNTVKNERDNKYTPLMDRLVTVVAYAVPELSDPLAWGVGWPSLWQMSPPEEADHKKKVAETDAIYINAQVLEPEEVTAERFGGEEYSDGPPMVELEGRDDEPEPDPEPFNEPPPFTLPPGEPEGQEGAPEPPQEGEEKTDGWNLPDGVNTDMLALEKLAGLNVPSSLRRKLAHRVMDGLGFNSAEVLEAINSGNFDWVSGLGGSRKDSWDSQVPPAFLTDLEAVEKLARVDAPQIVLHKLVKRIAANLGLMDREIEADIDASKIGIER